MNYLIYTLLPLEIQSAVRGKDGRGNLQAIIEEEFDIQPGQLFLKTRKRAIVNGRHLFCSIMYHTTRKTESEVGERAGAIDHASVHHAKNNISLWLVNEKEFRAKAIRVLFAYMGHNKNIAPQFITQQIMVIISRMIKNKSHEEMAKMQQEDTPLVQAEIYEPETAMAGVI